MPSRFRFRLADAIYDSLGTIVIFLLTTVQVLSALVSMEIAHPEIPALFGMDVNDKESLTPCTVSNRLEKRVRHVTDVNRTIHLEERTVPLILARNNHVYAELHFATTMHFTRNQLDKLHHQFFHPSANKSFNLLKRSKPKEAISETFKTI